MTAVDVDLDLESIEHLDFDLQCELRLAQVIHLLGFVIVQGHATKRCEEPAVGMIRCRGCAASGWCCETHRAQLTGLATAICSTCRRVGRGVDVYEFEPLRVTS